MSPSSKSSLTVASVLMLMLVVPQAVATTDGVLVIEWDANTTDADLNGYRVFLSTDASVFNLTPDQARAIATTRIIAPNVTEAAFSALDPNGTYYIAVTAFDASGNESGFSEVVGAQPCNVTTSGVVAVQWDASSAQGVSGHRVYVSSDPAVFDLTPREAQKETISKTVGANSTGTTVESLDSTRTYYIGVTTIDAAGVEGGFSEVVSATPSLVPTLCSVSPFETHQGASDFPVTLYGANLDSNATALFGPDVTVASVDVSDAPARIVARINIGSFAQVDSRDVSVTNPDGGSSTLAKAFDVLVDVGRVDINGSSRIDGGDMVQVAAGFTARLGEPRYSLAYDLNVDGVVDGADLSLLILYFGMSGPF